jgi:hypothetical protein
MNNDRQPAIGAGGAGGMAIRFVKLSDRRHRTEVTRADGSTDAMDYDSRSYLRHDLAHYAVEATLELHTGFWGSVAAGASFGAADIDGADVGLAERLAGPIQTLMRRDARPDDYHAVLTAVIADPVSPTIADALHTRARALSGHWAATPYGEAMALVWPPSQGA